MSSKGGPPSLGGDLGLNIANSRRGNTRPLIRVVLALLLATTAVFVIAVRGSLGSSVYHVVPAFAQQALDECAALVALPGPPPGFSQRTVSDRFEDGTAPTLIVNATIWTGDNNGREVIHGGSVLLDRGIVIHVGKSIPETLLSSLPLNTQRVNAQEKWVTPAIVDLHNHAGVESLPGLLGSADGNSLLGIAQPWLRSIDGIDTHDKAYELTRAGGVGSALILPGSANAIGGQAFMIKLRATKERSTLSMVLEPPANIVSNSSASVSGPPRWRHIKHAAGENPSRVYAGTRMDTIWKFRESYNEARKIKLAQDAYCAKAQAGKWAGLAPSVPTDLKWEALVDVLRHRVKVNVHIYETVDFTGIVGLSNEFQFPIAAFHHAHEAYLVPEVIKQAYGETPGVAIFATFSRYKKESFRASEYAPRILHDAGIRVSMKSDAPFPVNARYLLHEAAQAHYYGLDEIAALQSVTTIPADLSGLNHRIGYLRKSYDADVVLWDSHPLTLGATPQQVWIDGIAQLQTPHALQKPESYQLAPKTPNFDKETNKTLEYDGLPPLTAGNKTSARIVFTNVNSLWVKAPTGIVSHFTDAVTQSGTGAGGVVVVEKGRLLCAEPFSKDGCLNHRGDVETTQMIDLKGGSISPAFVSYGSALGLTEIIMEPTTGDGLVYDPFQHSPVSLLDGVEARAADGLIFGTRDSIHAYRSGVTSAITAPISEGGFFRGISTAFATGASDKLDEGALLKSTVALHFSLSHYESPSISTQIGLLRKGLEGGFDGDRGKWFAEAAKGAIPLAIDVEKADHIVNILTLKKEFEASSPTGAKLRIIFLGGTEAHLVADHIASAGASLILLPTRQVPLSWDQDRFLPGPPLSPKSSVEVLLEAGVKLGLGVSGGLGGWFVRNTRLDVGWVSLASNGTVSRSKALSLASLEIENIFALEPSLDLIAYEGGGYGDFESKVVGVISPKLGSVDVL